MNRLVAKRPAVHPRSDAIVARMRALGGVKPLEAYPDASRSADFYHPFYFSRPGDPVYTIRSSEPWHCDIDGERVRIPRGARPAQGSDRHMAVIDQDAGLEYDMWHVQRARLPAGGGTIRVGCGGVGSFDDASDPITGATAAGWGLLAGVIRSDELAAGEIDHALFATVACSSGRAVAPASRASGGAECAERHRDAPSIGQRLWLDMSESEIDELDAPAWRKAVLRALARYGAYVGDTGGGANALGFQLESDETYRSFGAEARGAALARRLLAQRTDGVTFNGAVYRFELDRGFPWERLRVLRPPGG